MLGEASDGLTLLPFDAAAYVLADLLFVHGYQALLQDVVDRARHGALASIVQDGLLLRLLEFGCLDLTTHSAHVAIVDVRSTIFIEHWYILAELRHKLGHAWLVK